MRNKYITRQTGKNYFTTSSKLLVGDSNEEFFESSNDIKPIKNTHTNKDLSDDKLTGLLQDNKQDITNNIHSAVKAGREAETIRSRSRSSYARNKHLLSDEEKTVIENTIADSNRPRERKQIFDSEEEKALYDIENNRKKLINSMLETKYLDEALTSKGNSSITSKKDSLVNETRELMKELKSMSDNINNGVNHNDSIRQELRSRGVSLYPEEFDNHLIDDS
jgi:hypothetical protein